MFPVSYKQVVAIKSHPYETRWRWWCTVHLCNIICLQIRWRNESDNESV